MKLNIEESPAFEDVLVTIQCPRVDCELQGLIERIRMFDPSLQCRRDSTTYLIKPAEVFYIESIDDKTFVYCENEVYRSEYRLYILEQKLPSDVFVRVKKNCILNIDCIVNFKSGMNGKIEACLRNGERIEVARHYVPGLKNKLSETEAEQ